MEFRQQGSQLTLFVNGTGMNILQNNPYRLLGVYSNSPTRERLANLNRMKAFLKVGKQVAFPLDLQQYLPAVIRTEAMIAEADAKLTLPKDQIYYAQFWFVRSTPLDDVAFNHLFAGEIAKAEKIWFKKDCGSSLQNRIVCALMRSNYDSAIDCAEALYGNAQYCSQFVSFITDSGGGLNITDLAFSFLDAVCDEVGASKILPLIKNTAWKKHVGEKAVKPLIDSIQDAIEKAKESKGNGSNARLKAGETLMKDTKDALLQLKHLLPKTDFQYQMIADKLGLEILQCAIDYYNDSEEPNAARKAMKLLNASGGIVVGQIANDRYTENKNKLEDIISNLPPVEVTSEHIAIHNFLGSFVSQPDLIVYSIQLIRNCAPYIVAIKEILGKEHKYYLNISTTIVNNALSNVIEEVNEAQNKDFETLKNTLVRAWRTQLYMDKFDLEPDYKDGRFKQCRKALYDIINDCKGFESPVLSTLYKHGCGWCYNLDADDVDLRTDDEFYMSCCDLSSLKSYINRFPRGKHVVEAKERIEKLTYENAKTIEDYNEFIKDFPNSSLVKNAQDAINKILKEREERKKKKEKQEKDISLCTTTDNVISLYNREKYAQIDIEKCSYKAYELSKSESDYRKVVSVFGRKTLGGKNADIRITELVRERKKRKKALSYYLLLSISIGILLMVYFTWGFEGLSTTCYFLAFIFGLISLGCLGLKSASGCMGSFVSVLVLGFLGLYFGSISSEKKNNTQEELIVSQNDTAMNTDNYDNDIYSDTATLESSSETGKSQAPVEYETYIDNQLPTGSKPYKKYYRSRTGENYLDFNTSGNDYVIIVRDCATNDVVNHIYIRANDKGRLYLPNGTYNIYFYGGKGWNPNMKNGNVEGGFVSGGQIQKDGPIVLEDSYGEYTLYPVRNGNLQLQDASESEVF